MIKEKLELTTRKYRRKHEGVFQEFKLPVLQNMAALIAKVEEHARTCPGHIVSDGTRPTNNPGQIFFICKNCKKGFVIPRKKPVKDMTATPSSTLGVQPNDGPPQIGSASIEPKATPALKIGETSDIHSAVCWCGREMDTYEAHGGGIARVCAKGHINPKPFKGRTRDHRPARAQNELT